MLVEIPLLSKLLSAASSQRLDDVIDRLHFVVTVTALVLCSMFVGAKQHFGQPIQCMLPAHLDRGAWSAYGQYYCFVESTYRLTFNRTVPSTNERTSLKNSAGVELNYYQWVPYFFAIQALCFYLPSWIWHTLQRYSMLDLQNVVDEAVAVRSLTKMEDRPKKLDKLVEFIRGSFQYRDGTQHTAGLLGALAPNKLGFYSTAIYLLTKAVWLVNDVAQLKLMSTFLGIDSVWWALKPWKLVTTVVSAGSAATIHYFPRVTFCDMERYTVGQKELDTFQCVLMLNVINEKLFILLWYWIVFLIVCLVINLVYTISQLMHPWCRESIIRFYVQSNELNEEDYYAASNKLRVRKFIKEVLGMDGVLMLRFVHNHAGAIIARDITVRLFQAYNRLYPALPSRGQSSGYFSGAPNENRSDKNPFYWKRPGGAVVASAPEPSIESTDGCPINDPSPSSSVASYGEKRHPPKIVI